MRCPKCTSIEDKVLDSRISKEGSTIRRRRECLECGHRYSTTETLVRDGVVVIKRDGRREDFDREKLVRAVRAACHKRPIDAEQIMMLVEDVMDALEAIEYRGYLTFEYFHPFQYYPDALVFQTSDALDRILGRAPGRTS